MKCENILIACFCIMSGAIFASSFHLKDCATSLRSIEQSLKIISSPADPDPLPPAPPSAEETQEVKINMREDGTIVIGDSKNDE